MSDTLREGRIEVRPLHPDDEALFVEAARASRSLHGVWFATADTPEAFVALLERQSDRVMTLLALDVATGRPAATFTLSEICRGQFQSAYLGYGAFEPFAGTGRTAEGLRAVLRWAFERLGLHRVEANIRPENTGSVALVRRLGFDREGYSPAYLFLDGAWRDHERWAIRREG